MSEGIERLKIRGRPKLRPPDFAIDDRLYVAFDRDDIDPDTSQVIPERIRFPDFSCNWSRFSEPADVRLRPNGYPEDGCYSFTVAIARYKELATPVHNPISEADYENYAHVEVRELRLSESVYSEPPRGRKSSSKGRKNLRMEYRQNIINNLKIELEIAENT